MSLLPACNFATHVIGPESVNMEVAPDHVVIPSVAVGGRCRLQGLVKEELNGKTGIIVSWDPSSRRFGVSLDDSSLRAVKPANLCKIRFDCSSTAEGGASSSSSACMNNLIIRAGIVEQLSV